jgi:hypothetical protein
MGAHPVGVELRSGIQRDELLAAADESDRAVLDGVEDVVDLPVVVAV